VNVLWIGIGGFAGAVARYAVDEFVSDRARGPYPWGIFVVNVSGAFLLGLLVALFADRFLDNHAARLALTTGFLGAYTTFSTYMLQTVRMAEGGLPVLAAVYVIGSIVAGLVAAIAGTWIGRSF